MKIITSFLAAQLLFLPLQAQEILPWPQQIQLNKGYFDTRKDFVVQCPNQWMNEEKSLLAELGNLSQKKSQGNTPRRIIFQSQEKTKSEEGYTLQISPDTILITASTSTGFFYARKTLQQMLKNHRFPCCKIEDEPAYSWRGAMIDVSRHFFPIAVLKQQIDLLSSFKINRLHLHLTDAAGWRMEIKRYPRLTQNAAWRTDSLWKDWWKGERKYATKETPKAYGGFYTQEELRDLVNYAQQRHITIIPEIEMPAHSEEVLTAYPELSCTHEPYKQADFCPGNIATYDFLEHVLEEVLAVFPSPYIHIGGDEAGKASWKDCPLCQKKMEEEGISDLKGLQTYLIRRIGTFLQQKGRHLIGWDEIIDGQLPEGSRVMVWRNQDYAHDAIRHGYDVILSPASHCYLDSYQDAPPFQPEAIGGLTSLEKTYQFDPVGGLSPQEQLHVKGIQGNLWTEYVPTTSHLEYMLYPRILGIAEIGWNGTHEKNYSLFKKRAITITRQLREKGVNAFPIEQEIGDRKESRTNQPHKGVGAKILYHHPFSPYYPGAGATTLLDGNYGGWSHQDGRWQGFVGRHHLDVTIDLGKRQKIRKIAADFLQSSRAEIYYPATFTLSCSDNGKDFVEIYQKQLPASTSPVFETQEWLWKGNTTARYFRIEAHPGQLGGWIFIDEISFH